MACPAQTAVAEIQGVTMVQCERVNMTLGSTVSFPKDACADCDQTDQSPTVQGLIRRTAETLVRSGRTPDSPESLRKPIVALLAGGTPPGRVREMLVVGVRNGLAEEHARTLVQDYRLPKLSRQREVQLKSENPVRP